MEYTAAIDVSLELSSVCVVDAAGKIVREAKVASEPEALVRFFRESGLAYHYSCSSTGGSICVLTIGRARLSGVSIEATLEVWASELRGAKARMRPLLNRIERMGGRLKEWRAVATRYEKTARSFMGVLCLAAVRDWLKATIKGQNSRPDRS